MQPCHHALVILFDAVVLQWTKLIVAMMLCQPNEGDLYRRTSVTVKTFDWIIAFVKYFWIVSFKFSLLMSILSFCQIRIKMNGWPIVNHCKILTKPHFCRISNSIIGHFWVDFLRVKCLPLSLITKSWQCGTVMSIPIWNSLIAESKYSSSYQFILLKWISTTKILTKSMLLQEKTRWWQYDPFGTLWTVHFGTRDAEILGQAFESFWYGSDSTKWNITQSARIFS